MDIDSIGTPAFNPGWISRTAMPWNERAPLTSLLSASPLSISSQEPIGTLPEWQGIAIPGFGEGDEAPGIFERLGQWLPVSIPTLGFADRRSSTPNWLRYTYRMNRRARRPARNAVGIAWPEESTLGEQELAETADMPFDLARPSIGMLEGETELSDTASPFPPALDLTPVLDYRSLAHSQPSALPNRLGIAPLRLPLAVPARALETAEARAPSPEQDEILAPDAVAAAELEPVYRVAERAAQLRLERAPEPMPLANALNIERVVRRQSIERQVSAFQTSAVQGLDLIPSQLSPIVTGVQTFASSLLGKVRDLSAGPSPQTETEPYRENAVRAAEEYRQNAPTEFMTLRSMAGGRPIQAQSEVTGRIEAQSILSNSASERQSAIVASPDWSLSSPVEQDRSEAAPPISLASPAFTLLQPLRRVVSLDTRFPMQTTQPPPPLSLTAAPLALEEGGRIATSVESIAGVQFSRPTSELGELVRSVSEESATPVPAGTVPGVLQTNRVLAAPRANQRQESDSGQEFERANQPPTDLGPEINYAGALTPPPMQVRRAPSESRTIGQTSDSGPSPAVTDEQSLSAVPAPSANTQSRVSESSATTATAAAAGQVTAGATQPSQGPDVNALARQVYAILKDRLRAERERHEIYSR